jgi:hypothetical protein
LATYSYDPTTDGLFHRFQVCATADGGSTQSRWSNVEATLIGTDDPDTYTLQRDDPYPDYPYPGWVTIQLTSPYSGLLETFDASTFDRLHISTFGGNDTLVLDYTDGEPTPAGGVVFVGGAGDDVVSVTGSAGADAVTAATPPDGSGAVMMVRPDGNNLTSIGHPLWYDRVDHAAYDSGGGADGITVLDGALYLPGNSGLGAIHVNGGVLTLEGAVGANSITVGTRSSGGKLSGDGTDNAAGAITTGAITVYSGKFLFTGGDAYGSIADYFIYVDANGVVGDAVGVTDGAQDILYKIDTASTGSLGLCFDQGGDLDFSGYANLGLSAVGDVVAFFSLFYPDGSTSRFGGSWGTLSLGYWPLTAGGDVVINGNVIFTWSATIENLQINSGTLTIQPSGMGAVKVLRIASLSIAPDGQLDLADNDLILDYSGSSPAEAIRQYLFLGRNGGTWDGRGGIISSTAVGNLAIGWYENTETEQPGDPVPTTFDGQSIDSTTLILTPLLYGDSNHDGTIDLTDLNTVLNNFGSTADWYNGDFDYTGVVDLTDLNDVLNHFGSTQN